MKRLPPNDPSHPSIGGMDHEGPNGLVHRVRVQVGLTYESPYQVFHIDNGQAIELTDMKSWRGVLRLPYPDAVELEKQGKLAEWVETAIAIHMLTA